MTLNGLFILFSHVSVFDPDLLYAVLKSYHVLFRNFLVVGNGLNQRLRKCLFEIILLCKGR